MTMTTNHERKARYYWDVLKENNEEKFKTHLKECPQ